MKRRFSVNDEGNLVDRDGVVLGRVTSITIDAPSDGSTGGKGGAVPSEEQQSLLGESQPPTPSEPAEVAAAIDRVWAAYVAAMSPRNKELDPQGRKIIREALKVATADECIRAIAQCARSEYHQGKNEKRRKYNSLSHILRGRQGEKTTRERIDWWLDRETDGNGGVAVTSEEGFKIATLKDRVRRGGEESDDGAQAVKELADQHGIETRWASQVRARQTVRIPTFWRDGRPA
jgi:hypothetical protein